MSHPPLTSPHEDRFALILNDECYNKPRPDSNESSEYVGCKVRITAWSMPYFPKCLIEWSFSRLLRLRLYLVLMRRTGQACRPSWALCSTLQPSYTVETRTRKLPKLVSLSSQLCCNSHHQSAPADSQQVSPNIFWNNYNNFRMTTSFYPAEYGPFEIFKNTSSHVNTQPEDGIC